MEKYEKTQITYIYGLYEVGKEDEIRYIGKTLNPKTRLYKHRSKAHKEHTYKSNWIRSIIKRGGSINFKILEISNYNNWVLNR